MWRSVLLPYPAPARDVPPDLACVACSLAVSFSHVWMYVFVWCPSRRATGLGESCTVGSDVVCHLYEYECVPVRVMTDVACGADVRAVIEACSPWTFLLVHARETCARCREIDETFHVEERGRRATLLLDARGEAPSAL